MVKRVYVEKKNEFAVLAGSLRHEFSHGLEIDNVESVRVLIRYDVENLSDALFESAIKNVFSEPPVDQVYTDGLPESNKENCHIFSVEYLPGQFDQRADSAVQCIQLLDEDAKPVIRCATTYIITGKITEADLSAIKNYCINPVDSREAGDAVPDTLKEVYPKPDDIEVLKGFCEMDNDAIRSLYDSLGLAMTFNDFLHIQNYFNNDEHRDPTMTEIRVLDTYWSDHCRHTTFSTELTSVDFSNGYYRKPIEAAYRDYRDDFNTMYKDRKDKFICLMNMATLAAKKLKAEGKLKDQEESDEINACSVVIPVDITEDGQTHTEEWLLNFKNETHNHPTEIEPFGGAATCLGGAIRDPLSGRTYVYQAMRVTGAADPTVPNSKTLPGKLSQKKIVREAASGYSSYGNQIGLATGYVKEIYHPNYVAKRMEIGAVMAAAPRRAVQRLNSDPGDKIILLGGRTGRDGIGGATGSSKAHTTESTALCGAEVQKGNPPTERKLQRLFRREEVSHIIKKCNDFGAGGVSVAIGELADGLIVDLDKVPKKYAGLNGTELAISESQERMAVVVAPEDVQTFLNYAAEENLEATEVAVVTREPRLILLWQGKDIVNISRAFLDTNGAHQEVGVVVDIPDHDKNFFAKPAIPEVADAMKTSDIKKAFELTISNLNVCSQKGLVEMFDSSIGAGSVLMPYGGKYQLTETQSMVAKIPVPYGKTDTVSMMAYGFDPYLSDWSPFHGAIYAITDSMARIVASGGDHRKIRFTFQEYFRRMSQDPHRWSQPFAALLGAYEAQIRYGLPSIGGKDSMSGTFNEIDVPPTLVSFAVDTGKAEEIISPEFKNTDSHLAVFSISKDSFDIPNYEQVLKCYDVIHNLIKKKAIISAYAMDAYGVLAACAKMSFGNMIGATFDSGELPKNKLFSVTLGNILAEIPNDKIEVVEHAMEGAGLLDYLMIIGHTNNKKQIIYDEYQFDIEDVMDQWKAPLEKVFATRSTEDTSTVDTRVYTERNFYICKNKVAIPEVFIPVFPGTNCEYDSANAFIKAGATVNAKVFRNQSASDIRDSVDAFVHGISDAQIVMFPGGFSAGDEPEGSAKFFANAFRNEKIKEAVMKLINERDGLVLGICNGFQALIKLGLVPYGKICTQEDSSPTLTYNTIGRHISKMAHTKVVSNKSPWLKKAPLGSVYDIPASHGEGRFVASDEWLKRLFDNGQVATQYVNESGTPTMDEEWNINGSYMAIEGITSPDGRILGKMCHSERIGENVAKNIYGSQDMHIFEAGVEYFK